MKGYVLTDRHRPRRHGRREDTPLGLHLLGHGVLDLHRQCVLAAIGGPDDRRQAAQFQEFTHQAHPGAGPQGDDQMHHHH